MSDNITKLVPNLDKLTSRIVRSSMDEAADVIERLRAGHRPDVGAAL